MSGGYVALHRRLLIHPLWTRERFTRGQAWVDLILSAAYADHDVVMGSKVVPVKRGEILTSQVKMAARWQWDRETVSRFFRVLERLNMIRIRTSRESESGFTLITLVNWPAYQVGGTLPLDLNSPSDAPSDAPSDPASVPHPCHTINKGKKGKKVVKSSGGVPPPPLPDDLELARKDLLILHLSPQTLHRYVVTYTGKLDLAHELRRAEGWCQDNPTRAPRKKHAAFVTRWLNRACDGAAPPAPPAPRGPIPTDAYYNPDGCHKSEESAGALGQRFRQCEHCRLGEPR